VLVGRLADRWSDFGGAMTVVAIAPLVVVGLVVLLYPETAHRSLEELNPEDERIS
jgi:hypothetical protein